MTCLPKCLRLWLFASIAFAVGVIGPGMERLPQADGGLGFLPVIEMPQAAAQAKRRSLFSVLFGRDRAKRKAVRSRDRSVVRRSTASQSDTEPSAAPSSTVVEKNENARKVLVVGDFYGDDIFEGLQAAFAEDPNVAFINRTNGLSGFVRTDIVDWPAVIGPMVEEVQPDYIIFMGGSNDRQPMTTPDGTFDRMTPSWEAAYKARLNAMSETLRATGVPFTWVGLPSVRFSTMSRDFFTMNDWYENAAQRAPRGKFVDIWDGFSDASGAYSRSGPDVNGQIVLLRRKDGINMTRDGERRLAFYVEGDIRKALEGKLPLNSGLEEFEGAGTFGSDGAVQTYNPALTGRTVVINLDDPAADGGEVLAGETISFAPATTPTPVPLPDGANASKPEPKREGRVDDFSWPPATLRSVQPPRSVAQASN